ncbi:alanine:cation symporter family protein [Shigella flexneri]
MWVAAFIGMTTSFAKCSLAQLYKERDVNGQFVTAGVVYGARAEDEFDRRSIRVFCSSPMA